MIENIDRNIVCRTDSIESNSRMRIDSESSDDHDFDHLEPLTIDDIKRYNSNFHQR